MRTTNQRSVMACLLFLAMALVEFSPHAADALRVFIRGGQSNRGQEVHAHPRFLGEWTQLLTERGMKVSGGMEFPTAAQLAQTDVLVMYAQEGGDMPAEVRPGLEAFLKRGGGIVVIHTASVPLNKPGHSEYLKSVIGGAWVWNQTKWLEGPMSFYYTDRTHPITQGVANFDMDDEIYYDMDMDPRARILGAAYTPNLPASRRNDNRGQPGRGKITVYDIQPQMWTFERTLDGGQPYRAFVSIPGHQFKTFKLPHYRAVLLRGIAWAGKRSNVDEYARPEEIASLRYPEGGPSRPEKSASMVDLHPEFNMSLAAAEPLVNKPMNIDWDASGRMWVAETPEYPDGRYANGPSDLVQKWVSGTLNPETGRYDRPAHDKISILTDSNNDGLLDQRTIFHEGLELVTSFVLFENGVIAAQAPDILLLRDTNGDNKADKVEKLYTGLGTRDTHAVINNLRWGYDGWIYATHGYSSGRVKSGDGSKDFGNIGSGVVRFKPDGSAFEQYSSKGGNTWGLQISWDNEVFWTQPTSGDLLMHVVMSEDRIARSHVSNLPSFRVVSKSLQTYSPIPYDQLPYVQIDLVGRFTAAAGAVIYDGGAWPAKWNYGYFTTEPTINIVHHQHILADGTSYVGKKEAGRETTEFMGGRDMWFRPIEVRTGPDGAMYVVDFYNQAVIHNDTRGPKHGPRNAAVRPDRDHYYGRIWRVNHKQAVKLEIPDLARAGSDGLVKALEHPNDHIRMNAVRLIAERKPAGAARQLKRLATSQKTPQSRVAALWALARIGQLDAGTIATVAKDSNEAVRKNAMMAAAEVSHGNGGKFMTGATRAAALKLAEDSNPRVQLLALAALSEGAVDSSVARALVNLYGGIKDPHVKAAFMGVALKAPADFLEAAFASASSENLAPLVAALSTAVGSADSSQAAKSVIMLATKPASQDSLKVALLSSLQSSKSTPPSMSPALQQALKALMSSENTRVAGAALPLAIRWDSAGAMSAQIRQQVSRFAARLKDGSAPEAARAESAAVLLSARSVDTSAIASVNAVLSGGVPESLQLKLVETLGSLADAEVGSALISSLPKLGGEAQAATLNQLLKRSTWSMGLLDALDSGAVPFPLLGPGNAYRLRLHPDAKVSDRAAAVIAKLRGPEIQEKDALISKFAHEVEKPGNAVKGRELYQANCANCHQFAGTGKMVGPPLDGMGAHGAAELLVHILDPNREVDLSFIAWSIETKDGESHQGVIARENNAMVALRDATGEKEIRKDTIASRRNTGRSLMPEGLEALGAEGLRDLLTYVAGNENRFRFVDLNGAFTADSRKGMYRTLQAEQERLHISKRGVVTVHGVPFRISEPTRNRQGYDVVVLKGGAGGQVYSRSLPQKVEAKVGLAARQLHFLGGVAGWGFPAVSEKIPAMKVVVHFAGGATEEFVTHNGVEFGDYNHVAEVPGSKHAPGLTAGDQLRFHSLKLGKPGVVERITLESFNNDVAATIVAVTADLSEVALPGMSDFTKRAGADTSAATAPAQPLTWGPGTRVLLVGGGSSHDFHRFFNLADVEILKNAGFSVNYTEDAAVTARELPGVDAVVLSVNKGGWDSPDVRRTLFEFADKGKGIVLLHAGVWMNYPKWPEYNKQIVGGASRGHDRLGEFGVNVLNRNHPIMAGVTPSFRIIDELYYFDPDPAGTPIEILAETTNSEKFKKPHPSVWVVKHPKTRIAGIALGHDGRAHSLPEFKQILINSVRWAAGK